MLSERTGKGVLMGLASNSALAVAAALLALLALWTMADCVRPEGRVLVGRSLANIILAANYITIRLSCSKSGVIELVTILALVLACLGTAELVAHLTARQPPLK